MLASISNDWRRQGDRQNEKSFSKLNISSNILLSVFFHTQELLTDSFVVILMIFGKPLNEGRKNSPIGKASKYKNTRGPETFPPVETFLYKATELFQAVNLLLWNRRAPPLRRQGCCHGSRCVVTVCSPRHMDEPPFWGQHWRKNIITCFIRACSYVEAVIWNNEVLLMPYKIPASLMWMA